MQPLFVTPAEVLSIAFQSHESVREELINPTLIESAQEKFIRPVLGSLYEQLDRPKYEPFVTEYLKTALAFYVRTLVIEEVSSSIGMMGVTHPHLKSHTTLSLREQSLLRKKAKNKADLFIRRAVRHLEEHPELFPEFDPRENIQRRISMRGGVLV